MKIKSSINSKQAQEEINAFLNENDFTTTQITLIEKLFEEATKNKFLVKIEHAK